MRKYAVVTYIVLICFFKSSGLWAQNADTIGNWSLSAYADVYYALYSDSVGVGNFQKFPTVSPRSNSFGLNILQISTQYNGSNIRAMAALHFGDIPSSTWSAKYNAIEEAHAGIKLLRTLWLDAGFFRTHFGTEFLLPKENITSSVSALTYYEPYYESGLRLNYDPSKNLEMNLFLLNGYGIYEDNNRKKSLGLGITYLIGDKGNIGYTNYLGDDSQDSAALPHFRIANNVFLNYTLFNKLTLQVGGDVFFQQNSDIATGKREAMAYGWLATEKYRFLPKFAVYDRVESFSDPQGFLSAIYTDKNGNLMGYKLNGITLGMEYNPSANSYIRVEYRRLMMQNNEEIFRYNSQNLDYRNDLMINMGVYFDMVKGFETKK